MNQPTDQSIPLTLAKPYRMLAYALIACTIFAVIIVLLEIIGVLTTAENTELGLLSLAVMLYAMPILCCASMKGRIPLSVARWYPRKLFELLTRKSKIR